MAVRGAGVDFEQGMEQTLMSERPEDPPISEKIHLLEIYARLSVIVSCLVFVADVFMSKHVVGAFWVMNSVVCLLAVRQRTKRALISTIAIGLTVVILCSLAYMFLPPW